MESPSPSLMPPVACQCPYASKSRRKSGNQRPISTDGQDVGSEGRKENLRIAIADGGRAEADFVDRCRVLDLPGGKCLTTPNTSSSLTMHMSSSSLAVHCSLRSRSWVSKVWSTPRNDRTNEPPHPLQSLSVWSERLRPNQGNHAQRLPSVHGPVPLQSQFLRHSDAA